jgi:hypothetical protein
MRISKAAQNMATTLLGLSHSSAREASPQPATQ